MYYGHNVDMWEYLDMFCFSTYYVLVSVSHKNASEKDMTPVLYPSKHFS